MAKKHYRKLYPESDFDGTTWGMIGLGLAQFFITLLTLGFGAAYATCLGFRWYAKHTRINGKQLMFEGSAWSLFGHFIKWGFFTLITLGIYSFCIPVRLEAWKVERTCLVEEPPAKAPIAAYNRPYYPTGVPTAAPPVQPVPYPNNPYAPVHYFAPAPYPMQAARPMPRPAPTPSQSSVRKHRRDRY